MRVAFLGTPAFAVPSLIALVDDLRTDVVLVVTQPDRPAGRGRALSPPAVKLAALECGLPVHQPVSLREQAAIEPLMHALPDLIIVVAYGELLRREVLELAPLGCINVHPSLLPKYRGAAPIPAAILAGDRQTGVTIMKLVRRLDAGPIIAQIVVDISTHETTATLSMRLAEVASIMLPDVAVRYGAGQLVPMPQDESAATYTHEWTTDNARIDWNHPAPCIERLVRAADPWPVAWTFVGPDRLRILSARVANGADSPPIGIATQSGTSLIVGSSDGALELQTVQPAGKRAMPALDWWRGLRVASLAFGVPAESA